MKEKAHRSCRKELAVKILHTSVSEPRGKTGICGLQNQETTCYSVLCILFCRLSYFPQNFVVLILLKRKGDKSVQEYETDAGIQKWTEQRLTKSSAQETRCFSTIY
ncbi:uncharacterized protein LOC114955223 [Acropora millepora]|uniref:uncharacterized protein LOC114955223 n=1 Tax=Acropora millepora TaxID=45264 RepID=UPI001CF4C663|nr:uncharacterized protein LOC114955223 [Acropora millepora]